MMHGLHRTMVVVGLALAVCAMTNFPFVESSMCGCPPLWTGFDDHCYRFFSAANVSWIDAELHCRSFSMPCNEEIGSSSVAHLVSIHSKDEMDFVSILFDSLRTKRPLEARCWIGLHDRTAETSAEWTDGSDVSYTAWAPGQPNDQNGYSDCVFISRNTNFQWNDIPCGVSSRVEHFICKMRQR